jgi:hypothetical protein
MALNLDKMRQKLNQVTGLDKDRSEFWRPEEGENNVRIIPTPDGDPFKEFHFHYNVGTSGFLCPKRNFGDECPVCNFANRLWADSDEDSRKMAKSLFAKQRFFSPVLVRGNEEEGVKVWGFGKMAYQKLLNIVLDPDYGDITDPEKGNDLKVLYEKASGASFPTTDIRPRPRKTPLCDEAIGGEERCAELLENVPSFDNLFERKSTEVVQETLDRFLNGEDGKEEVNKYNTTNNSTDAVESAFNELLGA